MAAFSVILAHSVYLSSASCFALVPVASQFGRTGSEAGCSLEFDPDKQAVVVSSPQAMRLVRGGKTAVHFG